MSTLLDLVLNNISKFLSYLNINIRIQNKIFTIVSVFPTLYILRIVRGYFRNENYVRGVIYLMIFIVLVYFIILNFFYYFREKKVKWDVTNFIEDIVPEDLTFQATDATTGKKTGELIGLNVPLIFNEDSDIIIEETMEHLIQNNSIPVNNLSDGVYQVEKFTLIPYYKIRRQELYIGYDLRHMSPVATLDLPEHEEELIPLGVFVLGGTHQRDGIIYKEPYDIQLRVKYSELTENQEEAPMTRRKAN